MKLTKKEVNAQLAETRAHLEAIELLDKRTTTRVMKVLKADIWAKYWSEERDALFSQWS